MKKSACNLLFEQEVYRLRDSVYDVRENLLRLGMGCSPVKAIHDSPHNVVDIKDGSHQVYF